MKIETFQMERMQSTWENAVDYNLSESGVHPLTLEKLLTPEEFREISGLGLGYSHTNGTPEIREEIRKLYPGANVEQILVTAGSSEANFLLMWSLVEPGDEVVLELPNYMQTWGLLRSFGARIKPLYLRERLKWQPDLEELKSLVTNKTKLILLTNPNNPTGSVLSAEAMNAIISAASKVGAWVLADEVYQGAELDGRRTPSIWGRLERAVCVNGLSKAYGLPGLRIGWIAGPEELLKTIHPYHDYTTICPSALGDRLARIALSPVKRGRILERTRTILNANFPLLDSWLRSLAVFEYHKPQAGAICFARYGLQANSTEIVHRLIHEKSVLLVPGDHFKMDGYLRFGYGAEEKYLVAALARAAETFLELKSS